jgi:DnaJ-class molecular chaperone
MKFKDLPRELQQHAFMVIIRCGACQGSGEASIRRPPPLDACGGCHGTGMKPVMAFGSLEYLKKGVSEIPSG